MPSLKPNALGPVSLAQCCLLLSLFALGLAQTGPTVTVTGYGADAKAAEQDALRLAVAKVLGESIGAWTKIDKFQLIEDVILTRSQGYISSHEIIGKPKQLPDKTWEVTINATVSISPLEQDAKSLAQWLGGLRFMTVYDPRKLKTREDTMLYNYAYERVNEYLARHDYRYIERAVFDRFKDEVTKLMGADTSSLEYAKKLAIVADAEFLIDLHEIVLREELKALGIKAYRATVDVKSYDNCTAEGLGTVVGEGEWQVTTDELEGKRKALDGAVQNAVEKLLYLATKYLWEWCRNGAPFEIRFYGVNEDQLDSLVLILRQDPDYGGQLEPTLSGDYWRLNTTFKKTAYDMRLKSRQSAVKAGMPVETRLQYGRQLTFAPKGLKVPEIDALIQLKEAPKHK